MKKLTILTLTIIAISSCSSSKTVSNNEIVDRSIHKTGNPNTPYIYKNGFKNYTIEPTLVVHEKDSSYVNELRFNDVFSALYLGRLMYNKYGKWDKEVWPEGAHGPIFVWEKRKLIESQNELYSVATYGVESMEEIFTSVIVFDSKNRDCLTETSAVKITLIKYFSSGIRNIRPNKKFYAAYWKSIKEHRKTLRKDKRTPKIQITVNE